MHGLTLGCSKQGEITDKAVKIGDHMWVRRTQTLGFLALFILTGSVTTLAQSRSSNHYYYYFFDSKRALTLDVERLALFRERETAFASAPDLQSFSIEDELEKWPIQGWWIATTPLVSRTTLAVDDHIDLLGFQR